jgi:3-oxoadipate enol-lactonase
MPVFTNSGARIYYRLEGGRNRPLLVFAHSLGADHSMWDPQVRALLPHFQVLRVDLRGHGASDAPAGDYSLALLAKDILAAVDTVGARPFAFCGLSLGGMIGQWLAANAGHRLSHAVLANTSPRVADPSLFEQRRLNVLANGMAAIADSVMQRFFSATTLSRELPRVETVRNVLLATDPVGYAGCCAAVRDMDNVSLLGSIRLPVLLIGSDQDLSTPWSGHGDVLAAMIPAAKVVKLQTAHLSNLEDSDGFNDALLDFLLGN